MENVQNAINWFEIPVTDFPRAKSFYEAIYQYEMPVMEMDNSQMGMLPHSPTGIGGAICRNEWYKPSAEGSRVYLNGGDDLQTILDRVEAAGGKVILTKTNIGQDMGYYAFFTDSEGNTVGLHSMN